VFAALLLDIHHSNWHKYNRQHSNCLGSRSLSITSSSCLVHFKFLVVSNLL